MASVISRIHIYVTVMLVLAAGISGLWYSASGFYPQAAAEGRFRRDCVEGQGVAAAVPETCRSEYAIRAAYGGLDIRALVETKRRRMAATAHRIASGELQDPLHYKECIARGECAEVPLLPPAFSKMDSAHMTPEQQKISAAFWDLVESDRLTAPICEFIAECRVLNSAKIIDFGF
ncbi:MAG: hypothetical protein NDJ24_09370 [Alphaproteobacteria bacterium]|nr:hypothetical protein [Alphaproteobacteria bacterium]